MLVRSTPIPERILAFGGPGTGKTKIWLDIARLWQNTGTPGTFHVIDTDFTASTMMALPEYAGLTNIAAPRICMDYTDIFNYVAELDETVSAGDWVNFDMVGNLYEMARDYFSTMAYKMSEVERMLEHRESGSKQKTHFDGFTDWPMVRSMHDDIVRKLVRMSERKGIHLYGASPEKVIVKDAGSRSEKDQSILSVFGSYGARPDGHKKLAHWYHDVVYLKKTLTSRSMQLPKSRLRDGKIERVEVTDFAAQFLLGIDGPGQWKVAT